MLGLISSPYARRGAVFEAHARDYGPTGAPLFVGQGASRGFNPSLPQSVVNRALACDPQAASAEYPGVFRSDLEAFNSRDLSQSAVDDGALVRPPFIPTHATADRWAQESNQRQVIEGAGFIVLENWANAPVALIYRRQSRGQSRIENV